MIKTDSNDSDEVRTSSLSFVTPPEVTRQSFALRLRRSSCLLPKTLSSPRVMGTDNSNSSNNGHASEGPIENNNNEIKGVDDQNNIIADDETSENFNPKTKEEVENQNKAKKKNELSKRCTSNTEQRPKKKSVTFDEKVDSYQLRIPRASDMSSKEKRIMWYDANEFDQFKYEAAKHAGVKVVRYDSEKMGQGHHFVMMGDFDFKTNEGDAGGASNKNKSRANKSYHNENEYNDSCNGNGEAICKRGLGYHFSRSRKKSRAATRSTVMAWQKMLKNPGNQSNPKFQESLPSLGGDSRKNSGRANKTRAMLALVSAKCSGAARTEAKWRGDVDYGVAYPDRHAPAVNAGASSSANVGNGSDDSANAAMGKRDGADRHDGGSTSSRTSNAKRQRVGIGGCRSVEVVGGRAPPTPNECISGMLRAKV